MTAPVLFVNNLRNQGPPLRLGSGSGQVLQLRAQVLEAWDAVRVEANSSATVKSLKDLALQALYPNVDGNDYVVKLHGWEVLDESAPLSSTGARNGSIFLISDRRRRPVE